MPLPVILGVSAALFTGALGAFGGVKLGHWLQSKLSPHEEESLAIVFQNFGIHSKEDILTLSPKKQQQLLQQLEHIHPQNPPS